MRFSRFTPLIFLFSITFGFSQSFTFKKALETSPNEVIPFCIDNTSTNISFLKEENTNVLYSTKNWLFISATPTWMNAQVESGKLEKFYFEFAPPAMLNDTTRAIHSIDQIHQGTSLPQGYTGKDVLIGFIDNGIDYDHPDFLDGKGQTRVLRYWDQINDGPNPPAPYAYGQEWDSTDINNNTITIKDNQGHGTTVAGCAAGNGTANGTNKGMAPNANIVMVHTDGDALNWTITVAQACEYIFRIADEYNMPAVVNISFGTYYGSHDGNDPASEMMEALLDEKPGRIIVAAAGNSGDAGKYHNHGDVDADTSFVWFLNNPSHDFGPNKIFFDMWSDTAESRNINIGFAADLPAPTYGKRGQTAFRGLMDDIPGPLTPVSDTIYNSNGDRIATIDTYREIIGGVLHSQIFFSNVDSTSYYYRFQTTGSGTYDLWSGISAIMGANLNNMVSVLPSSAVEPDIIHYNLPDSLQTIVSSWNCSEKIITVGNLRNRLHHIDKNGNEYSSGVYTPVGKLSPNSSKGPNRHNVVKPDISASGDVALSAGPLSFLGNPANNTAIDSGGWHVRNGGTSMASPVVTGVAALYLERCRFGTYTSYKNLITSTAFTDGFTGAVPNMAYGYGKLHGHDAMLAITTENKPVISQAGTTLSSTTHPNYQWMKADVEQLGETNQNLTIFPPNDNYQVYTISTDGCYAQSDDFESSLSLLESTLPSSLIFPNPASNEIEIQIEANINSLRIYDIKGKQLAINRKESKKYDVSNLNAGQYLLVVDTSKGIIYLKLNKID
ncbi:MAG: subtilisin family serine protease [Psychromonas sp.]|jgi:subtilisin family serine protease